VDQMIEEVCIGCWTKLEGGYSHRFWKPTRSWEPRHGETSGVENTAGGMYNAAPFLQLVGVRGITSG